MVAVVAAQSIAHADGVCAAGYRTITAEGRAVMIAVLEAGKKALPPAPVGWVILGDDQVSAPTSICGDVQRSPWQYQFTRYYQQVGDQDARNKVIADAAAVQAAAMQKKQPRLDAVMARMEKLTQQQVALLQKGDTERAAALNEDMAKLQDEYKKILDEGDSQQQFDAAAARAGKDLEMSISLSVNESRQSFVPGASNLPLPAGARTAVRWSTSSQGKNSESAMFLLGDWRTTTPGEWRLWPRPDILTNAAHGITVRINADPDRIEPTVASINFASLAALLQR